MSQKPNLIIVLLYIERILSFPLRHKMFSKFVPTLSFPQVLSVHIIIKQLLCHLRRPFCVYESLSSTIFSMSCLVNEANLAPTVQKVDSAILWIVQLASLILIHWIVIYPMDSAIQLLNNWGLEVMFLLLC